MDPRIPHARLVHAGQEGEPVLASPNERRILAMARDVGAVNRASLARATGLTPQSIMRLADGLTERGLLRPGQRVASGRGQPSMVVELVPEFAYTFGVAINTDAVMLVLIDFSGAIIDQAHLDISPVTRKQLFAFLKKQMARMVQHSVKEPARVFGVGISIPGFFVGDGGRLNPPEPLEELALIDLPPLFADALQLPAWVDNEGNASAVGECLLGVGRRHPSFVYFSFTHGFGGGVIIDGECMRGTRGNAGELAGMLPRLGLPRASLESLRQMVADDGVEVPTINAMLARFDIGWPANERWMRQVEPGLSLIASAVFAVCDPGAIVMGGRLPKALAASLIPRICIDNVGRRGMTRPEPRIVAAEAPGHGPAVGAASLPFKEHFF